MNAATVIPVHFLQLEVQEKVVRIECRITDLAPQPSLMKFLEHVLEHAAERMSLDKALIDRVVIASPDRFGDAVIAIKPGAAHTDNETGVAAAKTIPRLDGQKVVSDLVLQVCLFESVAEVLGDPPASNEWGVDQQQALYVICHEFGHAQDHALRTWASETPDLRTASFSIKDTANYYGDIVLTEFAASRNAAAVMTESLFNHETQEAGGTIRPIRPLLPRPARPRASAP